VTESGIDAIAALADPVRRRAYDMVVAAPAAVGRDEVAAELGVGRTLAAFHLDKLVAAGLLEASFARRTGRSGPGAGRPAKLYQRADGEFAVTVPPRSYARAARLLAETIDAVGADAALFANARRRGAEIGNRLSPDVVGSLVGEGYRAVLDDGIVRLANCPFQTLAVEFAPLVCGMNLALLEGMVDGAGWTGWVPRIDPVAGGCCVSLTPPSKNKKR
jgi:predicted ArsR family transcriptional regulator